MSGKYPTTLQVAEIIRGECMDNAYSGRQPFKAFSALTRDPVRGMDMRYFDMTLDDGRVYRVRVSDITPSKGA